jgi:hypothetical protein
VTDRACSFEDNVRSSLQLRSDEGGETPGAAARTTFPRSDEVCPVCRGASDHGRTLRAIVPDRLESAAAAGEAVVDSLGFCGHHGALLQRQGAGEQAIGRVLGDATDRMIGWLGDERRYADRLLELFWGAERTCVACKSHEQQVARHVNRLPAPDLSAQQFPPLCFPHYRDAVYAMKSPQLPALANAQLRLLEQVVAAIGPASDDIVEEDVDAAVDPVTLAAALRTTAGSAALAGVDGTVVAADAFMIDTRGDGSAGDNDAIDRGCPVCTEIRGAEMRWARAAVNVAKLRRDLWTTFPTCAMHIAQCAQSQDERLTLLVARYAATIQLTALQQGVRKLARDISDRQAASTSVFYHRKSPAWILGQQRRMISDVPRCPACERLIVAQDRAVNRVVEDLRGPRDDTGRRRIEGLCLKHLGSVYVLIPPGSLRSWLVAVHLDKLRRLRDGAAIGRQSWKGAPRNDMGAALIAVWHSTMPPLGWT